MEARPNPITNIVILPAIFKFVPSNKKGDVTSWLKFLIDFRCYFSMYIYILKSLLLTTTCNEYTIKRHVTLSM